MHLVGNEYMNINIVVTALHFGKLVLSTLNVKYVGPDQQSNVNSNQSARASAPYEQAPINYGLAKYQSYLGYTPNVLLTMCLL